MFMLLSVVSLILINVVDATSFRAPGSLGFSLNGVTYPNGSTVLITDIGEEGNVLKCTTDNTDCCNRQSIVHQRPGQFYFPNGTQVPGRGPVGYHNGYFRTRGVQYIRLHHLTSGTITGEFRCEIPDASENKVNLFINIVSTRNLSADLTLVSDHANPIKSGSPPTLTCTVELNQDSYIPVEVIAKWTFPNGSILTLQNAVAKSPRKYISEVCLNQVKPSDSGEYKCTVIIKRRSEHAVRTPNILIQTESIDLSIGDQTFQLKINGVDICQQWRTNAVQYIENIESALIQGIRNRCKCCFTSQNLLNAYFICNTPNIVTYRNTFIKPNDFGSNEILDFIETWVERYPRIKISSYENYGEMVLLDKECPASVAGVYDGVCGDANYWK